MDVSIILVNYNTIKLLVEALDSVFEKSEGFSYEIIVVDNNSTDNSKMILKQLYGNKINYVSLPENIGFGRANNEGIKISKGRYVLFLNPDTKLLNNAILIFLNFFNNNTNVGIVGGNLYSYNNKPGYSYSRYFPGIFIDELSLLTLGLSKKLIRFPHHNMSAYPLEVSCISGADLMIRRTILDEVGWFDPQYFMYYEDTDLNRRVKSAGYKIINLPDAKIMHFDSQSFKFKEAKFRFAFDSRAKYYLKTKNRAYLKVADFILLMSVNLKIFLLRILGRDKRYYTEQKQLIREMYFNRH